MDTEEDGQIWWNFLEQKENLQIALQFDSEPEPFYLEKPGIRMCGRIYVELYVKYSWVDDKEFQDAFCLYPSDEVIRLVLDINEFWKNSDNKWEKRVKKGLTMTIKLDTKNRFDQQTTTERE